MKEKENKIEKKSPPHGAIPLPVDVSDAPKLRYHLDKVMKLIDNLRKQYGV